jgi:hypothetical protein
LQPVECFGNMHMPNMHMAYVRAGDEGGALGGKRLVGRQRRDGDAAGAEARQLLQNTSGLLYKLSGGHQDEGFDAAAAAAAR